MARWALDIAIAAFAVLMLAFMLQNVSHIPTKALTELYFENYEGLPEVVRGQTEVRFIVKNLELERTDYRADVTAELYAGQQNIRNITLESTAFTLDYGGTARLGGIYDLPKDFTKARIEVTVKHGSEEEQIAFWVMSASTILAYEGLGNGSAECVGLINFLPALDRIEISASADYAQGFPYMTVWFDGRKIGEYEVKGSTKQDVYIGASPGTHYLDIAFINDYYNSTSDEDRNLYIDQVFSQQRPLRMSVHDSGSGLQAFDCKGFAKSLNSNGAARYKIMVGDER